MKFKNWVSVTLLIISSLCILMLFMDPIIYNIIGIVGSGLCTYLLTKYSKICDHERRLK